ncbi:MAG: hypothetical protein SCALA702_20490 [Melioribacteraceae bacterium]|nr:MAG: hypothetical protein SCALA702_20490 [Melioribacteraceae bacterium]
MKTLILFYIIVFAYPVAAQTSATIIGSVADTETGEPLPFVNIYVDGTSIGTASNDEGEFRLNLPVGEHTIVFSMIGYSNVELKTVATNDDTLHIKLAKRDYKISEVLVTGEDPGELIMRSAIEKKIEQRKKLNSYTYKLYTKFVVSTDTTTAGRSSGNADTTIFSIFETYSKGYFKKPDYYFNEIIQRRQSVNVPPQANYVAFGNNINIYDDYVSLVGEKVATPFHPDAVDFYDFELLGWSENADGNKTARIKITPDTGIRKLFSGIVEIDGASLVPENIEVIPNEAVKLPFDAILSYTQSFKEQDGFVVPAGLKISANVPVEVFWLYDARVDIKIYNVSYDYEVNPSLSDRIFDNREVELASNADTFDKQFWLENNVLPLRQEESRAYDEIRTLRENPDSIETTNIFQRYFAPVTRNIAKLERKPFTGFDDFLRYNRVEGFYLGGGYEYKPVHNVKTVTKLGYGTSNNRLNAILNLDYYFDEQQKYLFSGSLYSKISRRNENSPYTARSISLVSLFLGRHYADYHYSDGYDISFNFTSGQYYYIKKDIFERPLRFTLGFTDETVSSAYINNRIKVFALVELRDNPLADEGRLRSFYSTFSWNYSNLKRIANFGFSLNLEVSEPSFISSDYKYRNLTGVTYFRIPTLPIWKMDVIINAGYAWGELPAQKLHSFETSVSGFSSSGALRSVEIKEFYGDRYAEVKVEHNFGELIPGLFRIPNITSFGLEFILHGGFGWSKISNPERVKSKNPQFIGTTETIDKYYYEAGLGLNRLLLFFRFDLSARLSQVDSPQFRLTLSTATN